MNAKSQEHQTAIVTGASSGIGLGATQALPMFNSFFSRRVFSVHCPIFKPVMSGNFPAWIFHDAFSRGRR